MIKLVNLCLKFTKEYYALCNINLSIKKGERICLLGESESGKTSLLRTIAGLENEYTGEAFINGQDIKSVDFKQDVNLAYLPRQSVFFDNKTLAYNVEYAIKLRDKTSSPYEIEQKVDDVLTSFDLIQKKDSKVKELSDFEKYLLALARTTVRKVDILLVDNIFDYLNEEEGNLLLSKIKELYYNENDICIFSSEEESKVLKFEARVVKLNNGVIVGEE